MCVVDTSEDFLTEDVNNQGNTNMPMDYESYLLSASPPGFDVHYKNYLMLQEGLDLTERARQNGFAVNHLKPFVSKVDELSRSVRDFSLNSLERNELNTRSGEIFGKTETNSVSHKGKKRVSFADENGGSLIEVRVFTESPNSPPMFRKNFLSSLAQGASASVTESPPLVLKFPQPASDYVLFREKIEKENVSLENVIIKDYNLMGTVKVKNISFQKEVKIRYTYDGWESHHDIYATYVSGAHSTFNKYDTFRFEITIPPTFDPTKSIQFVICYEVDGQEFWDNNKGANYTVVSADWNAHDSLKEQESPVFDLDSDLRNWTEFSSWTHADDTIPYY